MVTDATAGATAGATADAGVALLRDDPAAARAPGDLPLLDQLIGAIAHTDQLINTITSWRTQLLADAARWAELAATVDLDGEGVPAGMSPADIARRTVESEVAAVLHVPDVAAVHLIHDAQLLTADLPRTLAVMRSGAISYRHALKVVEQADDLPAEARPGFDAAVAPGAQRLTAAQLGQRARRIRERMHPESMADRHRSRHERRCVGVDPERDGMTTLTAYLPAVQGLAIDQRLTDLARSSRADGDPRTIAQLRLDHLAELLIEGQAPDVPAGIRARVLVQVPVLTLLGREETPGSLDGYGPIDADTARELAARAPSFTRLLTHPETGTVLSVGRDRYAVPADLRTWLQLRDETCRHPGCRRRAVSCDLDHSDDYAGGGGTDHDNLGHLCRRHHRLKHHTRWRLEQVGAGRFAWTSPTGRRYLVGPPDGDDSYRAPPG
ncbi:MAG: DUF222 domain-containing protein [Microbacteriaceae bacterium]